MRVLRAIGYWKSPDEPELPDPKDWIVTGSPAKQKERVCDYLRMGMELFDWKGTSWCRLGCPVDQALMGSRDLTDGIFVWPEGLSHYVCEHSVLLPQDFLAHALANEPHVPIGNPFVMKVDFEWWKGCLPPARQVL